MPKNKQSERKRENGDGRQPAGPAPSTPHRRTRSVGERVRWYSRVCSRINRASVRGRTGTEGMVKLFMCSDSVCPPPYLGICTSKLRSFAMHAGRGLHHANLELLVRRLRKQLPQARAYLENTAEASVLDPLIGKSTMGRPRVQINRCLRADVARRLLSRSG